MNRAYGGVLSGGAVRERFISSLAFLAFILLFMLFIHPFTFRLFVLSMTLASLLAYCLTFIALFVFIGSLELSWLKNKRL